jgi:regulator of replication initiation timing
MNLCKQLGNEIESRTAMEMEINRLHERLEFEQKIAQAKEAELRAKLASYEKATQSSQKMAASIVRRY